MVGGTNTPGWSITPSRQRIVVQSMLLEELLQLLHGIPRSQVGPQVLLYFAPDHSLEFMAREPRHQEAYRPVLRRFTSFVGALPAVSGAIDGLPTARLHVDRFLTPPTPDSAGACDRDSPAAFQSTVEGSLLYFRHWF